MAKKKRKGKKVLKSSSNEVKPNLESHQKIKSGKVDLHILERKKTAALSNSFKEEAMLLQEQRKKLRALSEVVGVHLRELEQSLNNLRSTLRNKNKSKNVLAGVKVEVKNLQQELETIEKSRRSLVAEERRILSQLHTATIKKEMQKVQSKQSLAKLRSMETTLQYLLNEADYLLRQSQKINTSHFRIMQEIAVKENEYISQLTKKLVELKGERENILSKKKLVGDNEKQVEKEIKSLKKRRFQFVKH